MKKFYFVACSGSDMDSKMAAEFKQKNKNAYVPAKDGGNRAETACIAPLRHRGK